MSKQMSDNRIREGYNNTIAKSNEVALNSTFSGNTRMRKAEDRAVVSHLNNVFFTSVGATTTAIAPNNIKVALPATAGTYTATLTPTREFGIIAKKYIELKIKADNYANITNVTLDIVPLASASTSYYRKIFNMNEFISLVNGKEITLKIHVDDLAIVGTPLPLQLNTAGRINIAFTNIGLATVNVLDGLISSNSPNYHMIQFDDGLAGVYDFAYPIMKKKGIVGTAFITTSEIGNPNHMTLAQMHELQDNGWTIASHGHTHIDLIASPKDLAIASVELGAKVLSQNGFRGANYLAAPYNSFDSTIAPYVSHAVSGVRIGMGVAGLGIFGSIYKRKSYPASTYGNSIINTDTVQFAYDKYILARDKNVLYSFLFHNFAPVADTTYKWIPSDFEELLTRLQADGAMFVNFEEYMTAYLERNDDYPNCF